MKNCNLVWLAICCKNCNLVWLAICCKNCNLVWVLDEDSQEGLRRVGLVRSGGKKRGWASISVMSRSMRRKVEREGQHNCRLLQRYFRDVSLPMSSLKYPPVVLAAMLDPDSALLPPGKVPYFPAHKMHFFFAEKCDLNSTCVLCPEGKYYFKIYKYPYVYYTTSLSWNSVKNHEDDFSGSDYDILGFYDE